MGFAEKLVVIDPEHREVFRHLQPDARGGVQHDERHGVLRGHHGRGARQRREPFAQACGVCVAESVSPS